MALPLAAALLLGGARVAATSAAKRYGATALAAGSKYAKQGKDAVTSYFKKPEAPSKPDFVVDAAGNASKYGAAAPKAPVSAAPKPSNTITVDSAGVARQANYPVATQGSRALTVTGKKTIDPKYAANTPSKLKDMVGKAATITSTAQLAGSSKKAEAPTVDTSEVAAPAAEETTPKVQVRAGSNKVARVSVGGNGGSGSKYSLSDGTHKIGLKVPAEGQGGVGLKMTPAVVKAFGEAKSVQGSGNMDIPEYEQVKEDPQFDAEMKNYEDFKADGGDGKDIEGFNQWKKIKADGGKFVRDGSGKVVRTGTGGFLTSRY